MTFIAAFDSVLNSSLLLAILMWKGVLLALSGSHTTTWIFAVEEGLSLNVCMRLCSGALCVLM